MKKRHTLLFLALCLFSVSAYSQISEGGLPPSFNYPQTLRSSAPVSVAQVDLDVKKLVWEDSIMTSNGNIPRIAIDVPVEVDINSSGQWTTLRDSEKIWQQTITAKDAQGMIISYEDFYIPKGAKLFIYNEDRSDILGAYTNETYPQGGAFATQPISGNTITLEYVASKISKEEPRLKIRNVGYIYRAGHCSGNDTCTPLLNRSNYCERNVNCPEGNPWHKQQRGVVLLLIKMYNEWTSCSGSLINNTAVDGKPYVLTASHCIDQGVDVQFDKMIVCFNYEFSSCENQNIAPDYKSLVGVRQLVYNSRYGGSDTYLLQINNNIPDEWHPYYNGWDRSNNAATSGAVMHHPNWDVKKITIYDKQITSDTYDHNGRRGAENAYWKVVYNGQGVTEGGSSGSPLFNQDGLIIGSLNSGTSYCSARFGPDLYGKLWYAWDQYNGDNLKEYLDPLGSGVERLGGYDPSPVSGIEDEGGFENKELVLFPNPADDQINVNTSSIIRSVKIYDMQGKQVFSQNEYSSSTIQIPVSAMNKGVYTITVQTENKELKDKFLKK